MKPEQGPAAVETRDDDDFDPFRPADKRSAGVGAGWLALLLVLGLAGWNGWQWWQTRQADGTAADATDVRLAELTTSQDRQRMALEELSAALGEATALAQRLERLEADTAAAGTQGAALRRELDGMAAAIVALQNNLAENQAALAALAVRDETPGRRVELSEIAFLLRAANERLVLFGDRAGADRALALADAQLVALDDPLYLSVRQSIATARLALEQAPVIDTVALTQRLDQMQALVPALALEGEAAPAAATDAQEQPEQEPGLWARFKATLAGLVTVRRRADDEALFSLDDRDTLRQGLWLQLESARLALLRGDAETWNSSLARARSALTSWFDADDPAVRQALADLAQMEDVDLAVTQPDISAPWGMLNRLRSAPTSPAPLPAPAETGPAPAEPAVEAGPAAAMEEDAG